MQISIDTDKFDELQIRLLEEIIRSVASGLKEAGISDESALSEATGNIAFAIGAIIDGSRVMEFDGQPVVPILTFAKARGGSDLVAAEGGSWMHEYAFSAVDEVLFGEGE